MRLTFGKLVAAAWLPAALALSSPSVAGDHTWTAAASVLSLEGGWGTDAMSVAHNAPVVNPAVCAVQNAGYATLNTDTGRSLYHTLLLAAMLNGKQAQILIHGTLCAFNKPRIISVKIFP